MAKRITKAYGQEFKSQAVKLTQEIGDCKAAEKLGVSIGTIYSWIKAFKEGRLDAKEAIILRAMPNLLTRILLSLESM